MGKVSLVPEKHDYPYVEYVIIKKYDKLNKTLLKKAKELFKKTYYFENNKLNIKESTTIVFTDEFEKTRKRLYGNLFKDHPWVNENLTEAEKGKKYLSEQYELVSVAENFFKKFSSLEAAFEALFLTRTFIFGNHPYWTSVSKERFLEEITIHKPIKLVLVVQLLKQLNYDKNDIKCENVYKKIDECLKQIDRNIKQKKLTKTVWEERERSKSRLIQDTFTRV